MGFHALMHLAGGLGTLSLLFASWAWMLWCEAE